MSRQDAFQKCPLPKRSELRAPEELFDEECPLPSRRALGAGEQGRTNRILTARRLMVGAGLSTVALAVPLVAFGASAQQELSTDKELGSFAEDEEWDTSSTLAASVPTESELGEVTAAASRAKVRTPVEVSACVPVGQADGSRGIKQKLSAVWPLQEGTFTQTSGFSWRVSPISGELLQHAGVDWAASPGTPILAAMGGVVSEVGYNGRSGNFVEITHTMDDGSVFRTAYMHQLDGGIAVRPGQEVAAGEHIGSVGSTGWSTGPHLHFEVRDGANQALEPISWMQNVGAAYVGEECQ